MSSLSRDDVANLARLARIEMTDKELENLTTEFGVILNAVARVQEVATTDVAATSHPLALTNIFRTDVVIPSRVPLPVRINVSVFHKFLVKKHDKKFCGRDGAITC
jgi:aspartyl-tRNA(Asn)/glutamyl-tRNA(Gln) amidotransferase subunit C